MKVEAFEKTIGDAPVQEQGVRSGFEDVKVENPESIEHVTKGVATHPGMGDLRDKVVQVVPSSDDINAREGVVPADTNVSGEDLLARLSSRGEVDGAFCDAVVAYRAAGGDLNKAPGAN